VGGLTKASLQGRETCASAFFCCLEAEYSPFCRVLSGGVALFHVKFGQQHAVLPMFEKTFVNYDFTPFQHGENHV